MKESLKLRVNEKYAGSLFQPNEGRLLGSSIRAIEIARDDPRYSKIELIRNEVQRRHNEFFFFGWESISAVFQSFIFSFLIDSNY